MQAICIDGDRNDLELTCRLLRQIPDLKEVLGFSHAPEALKWTQTHPTDLAVLDVVLPDADGIALARCLREQNPTVSIVFLTAHREYAYDAMSVHPGAYLLKPVDAPGLAREIACALAHRPVCGPIPVFAHTFGDFQLLVDGVPVVFTSARAMELLALLIDQQGQCISRAEIFSILFELEQYTRPCQKYLDVIIRRLRKTLTEYGIGNILCMNRNGLRICPEKIDCDLYRFLAGEPEAVRAFRGEYLSSYAWANLNEARMSTMTGPLLPSLSDDHD